MLVRLKFSALIVFFAILVLFFGFLPDPFGFSPAQKKTLITQGDSGMEVSVIQQQLNELGYFQAPVTGYYGPLTAAALTKLQKDYGLATDGIYGPKTSSLLDSLLGKSEKKPACVVYGYYTGAEDPLPSSAATLASQGNYLTAAAPFWYQISPDKSGNLILQSSVSTKEIRRMLQTSHAYNVKVLALVHNLLYNKNVDGREVVHRILVSRENRQALIDSILFTIRKNGYDGIEIDIENIYPEDKKLFSQFIKELSNTLLPMKYYLSVALPARLPEQSDGWSDSFDYATIGQYASQVVTMAYDEHGAWSGAGPIASLPWVEKVIKGSLEKISPQKLLLGIPAYGFDWNYDQAMPRYISYSLAMATAQRYQQAISWDQAAQVPYFNYIDENGSFHQVYFENASSWAGKLDLAAKYGLRGIAIWRLGMEDTQSWGIIKSKFVVQEM